MLIFVDTGQKETKSEVMLDSNFGLIENGLGNRMIILPYFSSIIQTITIKRCSLAFKE